METLNWIQQWYKSNCDGYWEHMFGIKIYNVDNPGWAVEIDLVDTPLENKTFEKVQYDHGDEDWIICITKEGAFKGAGDSNKLEELLSIFKKWALS